MVNDSEFADDLFKVMESYEGRRFIHRLMEPSHMDAFSLDNSARDYNLGQSVLGLKLRGILAKEENLHLHIRMLQEEALRVKSKENT